MNWGRRLAYICSLAATLILASLAPHDAHAQLGLGSLVVTMTAPQNAANVTGTIPVTASVTIIGGLTVQKVQFKLDGANLGAADTTAPYGISWDTRTASNGAHTLMAVATDVLGAQWSSNTITVSVFNDLTPPAVSISSPAAGATVSGNVTIAADAVDNVGVVGVQFQVDGSNFGAELTAAPYSAPWNTLNAANGSHTVSAVARDAAGNRSTASVTVTVFNDTTAPSVSVTSPAAGATVSGAVTLAANASDNVGVVGVQFQVDGNNFGAELTAAPYTAQWNTLNATNGSHTISAIARDAAGNRATSAAVTVTVMNDTSPPSVSISSPAANATVSGTITVVASASDNVGVVGVQFKLDGANLGAEVTAAPFQVAWDTRTAQGGTHTLSAVARDAAGNSSTAAAVSVIVNNISPVALENQQQGSDQWAMYAGGGIPADDVNKQIKGYASAASVNKGDSITFYVSVTPAQNYTIDLYRMGYYQGNGARLLQSVGPLAGVQQPACPTDANTGLTECNWTASYTLAVPASWTSGVFLAKLTSAAGYQNWIMFVVRDDARQADLVYQQPTNTYQAYNNYPDDNTTGKSLYGFNSFGALTVSGQARAVKVSFNRPYADRGAGQFFNWEYYFVRWLEKSGYDVKYVSTLDTHKHGVPAGTKGFLSVAHDEYWSKEMYDAAEAARSAGVHEAFFGGNGVYWQVRFEASPLSGVADRVMVGYKDQSKDPVQGPTTTILWRDPFISRPEQTLMGVQFAGQIDFSSPNYPFIVQNSAHWVYTGTGVHDGDQIPGMIGYEMDGVTSGTPAPDAIGGTFTVLGASPFTDSGSGATIVSNATIYQAPSGAWVFGAGTTSWGWGLDLDGTADTRIQRMTSNILDRFVGKTN